MPALDPAPPALRIRRLALQIVAAVAVVLTFETASRALGAFDPCDRDDPYLGFAGTSPLYRLERLEGGVVGYRTAPNKRGAYRDTSFAAVKPEGGVRIFCLGGSSVRSDAFPPEATFPGLLELGLATLWAGRSVEVVNAGGGGTGTFQYREVAREVCQYEADLVVVYPEAGERKYMPPGPESELIERDRAHPERASARRILTKSRLYAAVRDGVRALCPAVDAGAGRVSAFSLAALDTASREFTPRSFTRIFDFKKDRVPPLIEGAVPAERIERAHRDFVENLTAIARDGRAAGVPVLFVDSVRNLKADFYLRFHVDPRDVKPGYLERWRALYGSALDKQRVKDYPAAIIDFLAVRECYVKDHDEILAHHIASCHEAMGNLDKAREEFERAFMSRALKAKIREAASAGGAALADPYPALVKVSPGGIPDATMFTDAFHPMPMANAAIARTILDAILEGKLVKGDAPVPAGLAAVRAAIDGAAARVKLDPGKELQSAVYAGKYARALDIGSSKQLSQMLYVEKMYYGYAQSKLGRGEAARQTWNALREEVLGQGAQPSSLPKLDTDADVVRHIFDFDLFSEF